MITLFPHSVVLRPLRNYTVNENCTGTITFADGPRFDILIAPNGKQLYLIQTNPNTVLAGTARRVSHHDADHDHE